MVDRNAVKLHLKTNEISRKSQRAWTSRCETRKPSYWEPMLILAQRLNKHGPGRFKFDGQKFNKVKQSNEKLSIL